MYRIRQAFAPVLLVMTFILSACSSELSDFPADGEAVYRSQCSACHQTDGSGLAGVYPPLIDTDWVVGSEERLVRVIMHGLTGTIVVNGETYRGAMPGHFRRLRNEDIAAVVNYIRNSWGNEADSINVELVERIAEEEADRRLPWTEEELEHIATR